jgi:hypothetical protein
MLDQSEQRGPKDRNTNSSKVPSLLMGEGRVRVKKTRTKREVYNGYK